MKLRIDEDNLSLPLATGVSALEDLLGLKQGEYNWVVQEFGSSCGDAVRSDLACQMVRWLDEVLTENFTLNRESASRVMTTGRTLKPLLTIAKVVHRTRRYELIHSMPLRCEHHPQSDVLLTFAALALTVDKPEDHGFGYHLHPLEDRGTRHLGYKLLFDPLQGQSWLSWELHGQGETPWGDPARAVLGVQRSKELYGAALYSVRGSVIAPQGTRFVSWSNRFERPGRTAFVAYPQVSTVTKWPRTEPGS